MEKDKPAGAGFEGTRRLVKRYKKETPGQPVDEVYRKSGLGKWFHGEKAKGTEPGWDRYNTKGERIGKCGDAKEGEAYAACLSRQKAAKLGKKKVGSFVSRKRAAQRSAGDPEKGGESTKGDKPVFVKTGITDKDPKKKGIQDMLDPFDFANLLIEEMLNEKNKPTNPALWDQAISKAKSKFDVYPSAYANAWAAKWYKEQGAGWKTAESVELDEAEKDHEYSMARAQLSTIEKAVMNLKKKMKGEGNLEAWVQSKITKAADYIDSVSDYIDSGEHDIEEVFGGIKRYIKSANKDISKWDPKDRIAHQQLQNKKGPESRPLGAGLVRRAKAAKLKKQRRETRVEDWQKVNRQNKTDGLSQKAVDAYRRENPGSKLQTAVSTEHLDESDRLAHSPFGNRKRSHPTYWFDQQRKDHAKRVASRQAKKKKKEPKPEPTTRIGKAVRTVKRAAKWLDDRSQGLHDSYNVEDWQSVNRKDNVDGLSQKAVDAYRRENPGSNLQTAVTEKNPKGKRAARRASFCSRMSGMKDKLTSSETANDPDSRINKALRRWNC